MPWKTFTDAPVNILVGSDVSASPEVLFCFCPDNQLQLVMFQCDPATSLKALFDAMWAGPRYLLVFGGVCPSVTALIARALPALRLVQVRSASDRRRCRVP